MPLNQAVVHVLLSCTDERAQLSLSTLLSLRMTSRELRDAVTGRLPAYVEYPLHDNKGRRQQRVRAAAAARPLDKRH